MSSLYDVADYIVLKLREGGVFLNVLKLHKLLYYTQAWNLAFRQERLFNGSFQAWVHGPVSRPLYDRYNGQKTMYSPVDVADIQVGFLPTRIPEAHRAHIDAVLEVYGDLTGDQLEEMTHREEPWIEARAGLSASARSEALISDQTMTRYYASRTVH